METNTLSPFLKDSLNLSSMQLVELARNGLKKSAVEDLSECLQLSISEFSLLLPVSSRTLQRYSSNTSLSKDLSDRVLHIAKVFNKALMVFGNNEKAVAWLKHESIALGGFKPLDLLDTYFGIELVFDELQRILHGVFA